jgi:uncharacterized Fe-S center protein
MPLTDTPVVQDQGILAFTDSVAIEQAAYDLINKAAPLPQSVAADKGLRQGDRIPAEALGADGREHLDAGAGVGLGTKECELVEVAEKSD